MDFSARLSRRNFVKTAATTAGVAVLGDALVGCGASGASNGVVTLTYWDYYVSQAGWVDNEIKLFEQAHPKTKIKKTTQLNSSFSNLYALAVRSKNTPDMTILPPQPNVNIQVADGWFMPLDKWANAAWKAQFPAGTFHEGNNMFNGKLYSAPISGAAPWLQLYVNNQVFRAAGLVNGDGTIMLPKTWDDVTHFAETITKKSNGQVSGLSFGEVGGGQFQWYTHVFTLGAGAVGGAYTMDFRVGKYTYASDRNYYDFLSLMKEWKTKGYFYPNSMSISDEVNRAYFERGKFGMTIGGVWNQAEWTQHNFTDYSLTTLISPTETPKAYFPTSPGGTAWAIPAQTKHPEEAWLWLNWLYSVEAGKRWVQMGEDLSVFPQDNDPSLIKFKPFSQYVGLAPLALPAPDPSVRNPETAHVQVSPVKPSLDDVLGGWYTGQISDLHSGLSDIQGHMQAAQDSAVKAAQQQGYKVSADDYIFADWDPTKPYITKAAGA
jgi:ABC-type glycerol-3-phosphate transport system substrate-binding protein